MTENPYYAFFTSGWTSTNECNTSFSTEIPFDAGSSYGYEPFSNQTLCLPVDPGFAYARDTPLCTRI
eukprot:SAG31_NODE_29193_length_399_cov_0.943333_1_plen_66_part_01